MALNQNQFAQTPVQGQLDLEGFGSNVLEMRVSNAATGALLPLVPGQAIKVANEAGGVPSVLPLAANTDVTDGFVTYNLKDVSYTLDNRVGVALFNSVMYMTSGAAINRWANVEVVYNAAGGGTVITSAGTNPIVGFAVDQATASGQLIRVYIINAQELGSNSIGNISGLQAILNILNAIVLPTEVDTPITTAGNGTLTAASLVGKFIKRSGPTSAFSDATDSALNIVAALNTYIAGSSFKVTIKNTTAYAQTITAGAGVTLTGAVIVPPLSTNVYLMTITSGTAVTLEHQLTALGTTKSPVTITNLTTVGAGTITAAGIVGGITNRTGSTAAFTDTTDTAANIIAALSNAATGEAFEYVYYNNTGFNATLAAGLTVTLAGTDGGIPAGTWLRMLVTVTSGTAVTMTGFESGYIGTLPPSQFVTGTTTTTFTAGELTGANFNSYTNTAATPGSIATRTATQMIGDIPNAYIGQTFITRVINQGTSPLTITAGVGVTLTGAAVVPVNGYLDFAVSITSIAADTMTFQNISQSLAQPPIAAGGTVSLVAAENNQTVLLNTASGSVATLPAATGSGTRYRFVVSTTVTSNSHKILAASGSDYIIGIAMGFNGSTAKVFASPGATNHSIQMPAAGTTPSGGTIGDWFEFTDIAANLWEVQSQYQAGTTPTTPFSTATS